MKIAELYGKIGADYQDVQSRLGDDRIIERFIERFAQDKTFARLKTAFDANDEKEIYNEICAFLEVCRSLSLCILEETASVLMEAYRPENAQSRSEFHVADLFDTLSEQYFRTVSAIEKELGK